MEILQHGRLTAGPVGFECKDCGCVFAADPREYRKNEGRFHGTKYKIYLCNCPECGEECVTTVEVE